MAYENSEEPEQGTICANDEVKETVMACPKNSDDRKADDVTEKFRNRLEQALIQLGIGGDG